MPKLTVKDFKIGDTVTWDLDTPGGVNWYQRHGFGPFEVTKVDSSFVYFIYPPGRDGGFYAYELVKIL